MSNKINHLTMCGVEQLREAELALTKYHCDVEANPESWKTIHAKWKQTNNEIKDNLVMCCPDYRF